MTRSALRCLAVVAGWVVLTAQSYGPADLDESFDKRVIAIASDSAKTCYRIDVWIAERGPQQSRGLMFVRDLPSQHGMIFTYTEPGLRSMWMKNTYISLDILFFHSDGRITNIARDTEPLSLASIASSEPVTHVLELNAGETARLGIEPGDRVIL